MSRDAHVSGSQPEKLVACDCQGLEEDCLRETEKKKGKKENSEGKGELLVLKVWKVVIGARELPQSS